MVKQMIEQQTEQHEIPQELIQKFDGDRQLVEQFMEEGYTEADLSTASIVHATKFDPIVILENGYNAGFYIETTNRAKYEYDSRTYKSSRFNTSSSSS